MSSDDADAADRCDAQIVVYLDSVTSAEVEQLTEQIADLLAATGLGASEDDEDAPFRSLVAVKAEPFPDITDDASVQAFLTDHVAFTIPITPPDRDAS